MTWEQGCRMVGIQIAIQSCLSETVFIPGPDVGLSFRWLVIYFLSPPLNSVRSNLGPLGIVTRTFPDTSVSNSWLG